MSGLQFPSQEAREQYIEQLSGEMLSYEARMQLSVEQLMDQFEKEELIEQLKSEQSGSKKYQSPKQIDREGQSRQQIDREGQSRQRSSRSKSPKVQKDNSIRDRSPIEKRSREKASIEEIPKELERSQSKQIPNRTINISDVVLPFANSELLSIIAGEQTHLFRRSALGQTIERIWFFSQPIGKIGYICEIDNTEDEKGMRGNLDVNRKRGKFAYKITSVYKITPLIEKDDLKKHGVEAHARGIGKPRYLPMSLLNLYPKGDWKKIQ